MGITMNDFEQHIEERVPPVDSLEELDQLFDEIKSEIDKGLDAVRRRRAERIIRNGE